MAVVLHTTQGDLPVLLRYAECPTASLNFLALCASHYFDGCSFYRHIPGVLLQTGDPTNTGKGGESIFARVPKDGSVAEDGEGAFPAHVRLMGPRRYFDDEGFGSAVSHNTRGTLSMAHKGAKANTNASQFFLLMSPQPSFDGLYTAFAHVDLDGVFDPSTNVVVDRESGATSPALTGDEVLAALEAAAAEVDDHNFVVPKDAVRITGSSVLFNPFAEGTARL